MGYCGTPYSLAEILLAAIVVGGPKPGPKAFDSTKFASQTVERAIALLSHIEHVLREPEWRDNWGGLVLPVPDEREFIRQAVAVFEMVGFDTNDGKRTMTIRHGGHSSNHTLSTYYRGKDAGADDLDLIDVFKGLVDGCVRDGQTILKEYEAQRGTP